MKEETNRAMEQQWKQKETHINNPQVIFDKGAKAIQWNKTDFSINDAGTTGHPCAKNEK